MAHIIYQTNAFILAKRNFGEAESAVTALTEKFGKITAVARGVRLLKSKLRYSLEPFSYSRLSLVAGREVWRIVDAQEIKSFKDIFSDENKLAVLTRLSGLVNRMLQGEEKNDFLWKEIKKMISELEKEGDKIRLDDLEVSTALKVLHNLGYSEKETYATRKEAVSAINKAIKESML